jgi:hypothetical protein
MRGKGGERARMPVGAFLWSGPLNFARTKTRPRIASRVQEAIPESAWAGAADPCADFIEITTPNVKNRTLAT